MQTIAIIGGGFAGTLVAANLLRLASGPVQVTLIERQADLGPGMAYSTQLPDHLLNVPAGRMGAWPDEVDGFLQWCKTRSDSDGIPTNVTAADFLPRRLYGRYVSQALAEAEQQAHDGVRLQRRHGEAVDLQEASPRHLITLRDGGIIEADRVVLALGNLPGEYPVRKPLAFYHGPHYVHQPWSVGALDRIPRDSEVLLVGAGLTAVDMVLSLWKTGHAGVIHLLSRHGLRPQAHQIGPPYHDFLEAEPLPTTVGAVLRRLREEVRLAAGRGSGWRAVVDAIRTRTPALWMGFSIEERARFLRHARPYWEMHRHRVAPQVVEQVRELESTGRLRCYAGRLDNLVDLATGARAEFHLRGSTQSRMLHVSKVINCTGPRTDYTKYQHPLMINLLARGLIDHDPLVLGVNALPSGEVLRYQGGPIGWLFTLGAPLKGVLWECTAVPEIRVQAREIARKLLMT